MPAVLSSLIPPAACRFGFGAKTLNTKPENIQASIHPSAPRRRGSSGGSIPGLPRAVLGFLDRCCPGEGKRLRSSCRQPARVCASHSPVCVQTIVIMCFHELSGPLLLWSVYRNKTPILISSKRIAVTHFKSNLQTFNKNCRP